MAYSIVTPSITNTDQQYAMLRASDMARISSGAGWFIWIAQLSVVKTVANLSGRNFHFVVGLGVTDLVNPVAKQAGSAGMFPDLIINGISIGALVLFWHFAKQGQRWAFIVGMVLYAMDALILVALGGSWLGVAFHACALFFIFKGYQAVTSLAELDTQMLDRGIIQG